MMRSLMGFLRRKAAALSACRLGATAVEFAIVAPLFLVMVYGVMEVGRALWIKSTMQFAVEETTRYAMVNTSASTSTLVTYAYTKLSGMNSTGITFTATLTTGTPNFMTVAGTYDFTALVSLVELPDFTLNASSRVPLIY